MDQEEFRDWEQLFATNGWLRIVRDAEEAIELRKERLLAAKSIDEVRFIQGEVAQLSILVALETAVRMQEAAQAEDLEVIEE